MAANSDAVIVALFCQSRCPANPLYGDRFHRLATSSSQVPTMNPSPIFILLFNRRQVGVARESRQMRLFRGGLPLPLQTALPRGPDRAVTRDLARMAQTIFPFLDGRKFVFLATTPTILDWQQVEISKDAWEFLRSTASIVTIASLHGTSLAGR